MNRNALIYLKNWFHDPKRKPLVLRGARQVGKTWLARQLAQDRQLLLLELNFERNPEYKTFFNSNDPKQIILNFESHWGHSINPKQCLLFLDEIQAMPELLAKLRWFYEDMPDLAVIVTGSLLEFVLEDHTFSMPVGRITYLHLEPLSFEEFLLARDREKLCAYLTQYKMGNEIISPIHEQLLSLFKEYMITGGLPAAVSEWATNQSLEKINLIHQDLIATYRDDFSKYAKRIPIERLDEIVRAVPQMLGQKFVYRHVNTDVQTPVIKKALDLLCKARLCHHVFATHANGVPLGAELNHKMGKVILLDTGLVSAALGLPLHQLNQTADINLINKGALSEQVVGQLLRTIEPFYIEPRLYYWTRMEANASSEIDYVLQHHAQVIPIEVKSGSTGSLKSLHYFMSEKKLSLAVRINSNVPSVTAVDVKTNTGKSARYRLFSIPFYLIEQIHRLIGP